jgi:hypothetical protein
MLVLPESFQLTYSGIYLARHSVHEAFKIGKTEALEGKRWNRRFADYDKVDWNKNYFLHMALDADPYHSERIIHKVFNECRVQCLEGNGETEWFDIKCLQKVLDFVRDYKKQLHIENIELGIDLDKHYDGVNARNNIQTSKSRKRFINVYRENWFLGRTTHIRCRPSGPWGGYLSVD